MSDADRLVLCPSCHRHVGAREAACPFCRAPFDMARSLAPRARAVTLAAAFVGIAACGGGEANTPPLTPDPTPAATSPTPPEPSAPPAPPSPPVATNPPEVPRRTMNPPAPPPPTGDAGAATAPTRAPDEPAAVYGGPPPPKGPKPPKK